MSRLKQVNVWKGPLGQITVQGISTVGVGSWSSWSSWSLSEASCTSVGGATPGTATRLAPKPLMGMPGVAFPLLFLAGDGVYSSSSSLLYGSTKNLALLRFLGVACFFFVAAAWERSFAASSFAAFAALAAAAFSALAFFASSAFLAFWAFSSSRFSRAAEAA